MKQTYDVLYNCISDFVFAYMLTVNNYHGTSLHNGQIWYKKMVYQVS